LEFTASGLIALAQVVWINILLSGDNAIAIGMACRDLPPRYRRLGIVYGTAAAIVMRCGFALVVSWLMELAWLKAAGGLLLLWIAISLARGGDENHSVKASTRLWHAVLIIVAADATMSLDNVLGIAAIARNNAALFIAGLVISMPLVMVGASLFTRVLERFPLIVWAGAALLGWVAGGLIVDDKALRPWLQGSDPMTLHLAMSLVASIVVLAVAGLLRAWQRRESARR
jgi:YjbE family integral membrane protein